MKTKAFLLIFCIFLFSFAAQNISLEFKGDENFYFESAKGMLRTHDVVTPRYMGETRFQKPIFFYWLILLAFKIFGINWFAARLPSILSGTFLALLTFAIANLFFKDRRIGLFAALFSATTPLYYRYARLAVPDMTLVFFITLALYYFLRFYKDRNDHKSVKLFFFALALAVLVKGPVGLILPLLIVGIFCFVKKEKPFGLGSALAGLGIFILIVIPWFYLMYKMHGEAYVGHIWTREILQRLGHGGAGFFITRYFKGFLFYVYALITKFLPYSLFIPVAFINSLTVLSDRFRNRYGSNERNAHIFLMLWIATTLLFFTFVAEKRTHYLLALSPAISIWVGIVFKNAISDKAPFSRPSFKVPYLGVCIAIIFFTVIFIISDYISGDKIPIWKFMLLIIPIILAMGLRYRNTSFMPSSVVLSLSVLYIATTVSQPFGLFMNKMERAALVIKTELGEGDRIGIGSHGIIPEELQVFFELPVENVKVLYNRGGIADLNSAPRLLEFLNSKGRIFCVIKRKDYKRIVPEAMKEKQYLLDNYYVWKRRIRLDKELRESFANTRNYSLREIFQNEIYVITNRRQK